MAVIFISGRIFTPITGLRPNDNGGIFIGDNVMIGPNAAIYTAVHPMRSDERAAFVDDEGKLRNKETARPVEIGDGCWIGGNVTILPGVKIGKRCVIGAGSVVTEDIPDDSFAAGNPCRVIRRIV